jgi:hypothetical protein
MPQLPRNAQSKKKSNRSSQASAAADVEHELTQRTFYREAAGHSDKGTNAYGKPNVDSASVVKQPKHHKQFTQQSQRGVRQRAASDRTG